MKTEMQDIIRDLAAVDRRLDNMRFLMRFQEEKRTAVIDRMRRAMDRTEARTTPVKEDRAAGVRNEATTGTMRAMTMADGTRHAVHGSDVALLDLGVLTAPSGACDMGSVRIGAMEIEQLGPGWWMPDHPKDNSRNGC